MGKIIGIDLGTTNSCVAVMEGGDAVVIANAEGNRTTPSVVAFSKDGERMVGQVAKRQAITNPDRTISSIKREMGSDYRVEVDGKKYTPQEISAMILQKLKADAEGYLGQTITEAVITVPAYFTDAQRQATKDAGKIAGLEVKRIINEPTAAALAYGVDKEEAQKIMVYDLGGGTFDVSILDIDDGVIEVLATAGNNRLGGDDFDKCVMDWMVAEFKKTEGVDLSGDKVAMQRLKEAAEKAKIELSGVTTTAINLPYITADATGPKHLDLTLTRAKFDQLTQHLVDATSGPVRQAMSDAGLTGNDISKVLMVGGSSRIPAVQEMVKKLTGKEGFKGILSDAAVDHARAVVGLRPALKGLLKVFHHLVIERGSAFGLRRTAAEPVVVPGHHSTSPKVYDVVVGKSPEGFCLTHELVDLFLRNSRRAVATDGDAVLAQVAGHLDEIVAYGDVHVETAVDAVVDHIVVGLCALHKLGDTGILIHPHALVGSELVEHKESARVLRSASVYPLDVAVPVRPGLSGNGKPLIALRKDSTQSLARVFLEGRLHDGGRVVGKLVEVADA